MSKESTLAKVSKTLMLKEPFYGFFLIMLNKVWDNKRVPTAGVSKNNINYQLTINEDFWNSLTEIQQMGILKHELLHIAFFHLSNYHKYSDKKLANIAMDMEINQYIERDWLPEDGIFIDNYPELNLDKKAGTRYYYDKLKQAKEDHDQNGTCGCPNFDKVCDALNQGENNTVISVNGGTDNQEINLDDHGTWEDFEDLSEAEKKMIDKQLDHILKETADMTTKKRGRIPGHISGYIENIGKTEPPKFDWRGYVRRFTGSSTKVYTKKLRRKENRRFSDNPGLKIKMRQHMLLAIDTSGSVSNDELREFMQEIDHIYRTGVDITIVQCDAAIKSIKEYDGKGKIQVHGRGGTEFDPVIEYYNENLRKFTSLVYFTDGEAWASVRPKSRVLWVLSERSQINEELPGKVIKLEL
jgi:predicted metal-dependent peptidase